MVTAGFNEDALLTVIDKQSIKDIPPHSTKEAVKNYFKTHCKDTNALEAEITQAPRRVRASENVVTWSYWW